ncbi:hypothetical protein MFRU_019g01630 [Monilinia fructicola]|nr:hypothetical protein MFRU_019g01630 [Monilinia fructicola]
MFHTLYWHIVLSVYPSLATRPRGWEHKSARRSPGYHYEVNGNYGRGLRDLCLTPEAPYPWRSSQVTGEYTTHREQTKWLAPPED